MVWRERHHGRDGGGYAGFARKRTSGPFTLEALGELLSLERLDLSGNQLSGPIPSSLGQLQDLEQLTLEGNQLSGSISLAALGQLRNPWGSCRTL